MKKDEQGRARRPAGAARTAANETPGARGASGRGRRSVSGRGDPDALRRGGAGGNSFAPADEMPGAFDVSGTGGAQSDDFGASGDIRFNTGFFTLGFSSCIVDATLFCFVAKFISPIKIN